MRTSHSVCGIDFNCYYLTMHNHRIVIVVIVVKCYYTVILVIVVECYDSVIVVIVS